MSTHVDSRWCPDGLLRPGYTLHFVRWRTVDGDWMPEIVVGQYLHRNHDFFIVEIRGEEEHLNRDQWFVCTP